MIYTAPASISVWNFDARVAISHRSKFNHQVGDWRLDNSVFLTKS